MKRFFSFLPSNTKQISIVILILGLFIFLRFYGLKSASLFNDEYINVRRAQIVAYDATERFYPMRDGKQPLYIWTIAAVLVYLKNPVVSAYLVSIGGGALTLGTLYLLSMELFKNKWVAILSMGLYAVYPFAVLMNRQILFENFVGFFSVMSLYVAILLIRKIHTGNIFLLAHVLAGGILTKSSGFLNIYLLPVVGLLLPKKTNLLKLITAGMVAIGVAYFYYAVLYLSPYADMVGKKNAVFLYTFTELIHDKIYLNWPSQFASFTYWIGLYFGFLPLIPLLFLFKAKKYWKEILVLFLWFFLRLLAYSLMAKEAYPRHLFDMSLSLLPLIALGIVEIVQKMNNKVASIGAIMLLFLPVGYSNMKILTDLPHAPIPELDLFQYANGWPSGDGMKEIITQLQNLSTQEPMTIYTEGGFTYGGLTNSALYIYFVNNPGVERIEIDEDPFVIPEEAIAKSGMHATYVLLNRIQESPNIPMDIVVQYQKGIGDSYIRLYKVKPR